MRGACKPKTYRQPWLLIRWNIISRKEANWSLGKGGRVSSNDSKFIFITIIIHRYAQNPKASRLVLAKMENHVEIKSQTPSNAMQMLCEIPPNQM
jgi:hypothetical protein